MQRINALWNRGWVGKAVICLGVAVIACCVLGILVPRQPAQQSTAQPSGAPAAAGAATNAPAPTEPPAATAGPTDTPAPTNTPAPTSTPAPTDTPEPTPTPIAPVVITGNGQTVTDKIDVPYQIGTVAFTHQGRSNFAVKLYTAGSERPELLVNTIGNYQGTRLFQGESPAFFEIDADGAWELTLAPLTEDTTAASAQGTGDWVSGVFAPTDSGPTPYRFTHNGTGNFAVYLHCDGQRPDLLQNEIGAAENEAVVRFGDGLCLWEVQADGDWTIAPK